jgi:hypothetical protein
MGGVAKKTKEIVGSALGMEGGIFSGIKDMMKSTTQQVEAPPTVTAAPPPAPAPASVAAAPDPRAPDPRRRRRGGARMNSVLSAASGEEKLGG